MMYLKDYNAKYIHVAENVNLLKLSSQYDNNCSMSEYVAVNDETLKSIILTNKYEARLERYDRDIMISLAYNDEIGAESNLEALAQEERYSFIIDAEEELYQEQLAFIRTICNELTDLQRDRLYAHFVYRIKFKVLAEYEGVSAEAVRRSCKRAIRKLQKHKHFLLRMWGIKWAFLLKSPNFEKYSKFFSSGG